jgi:hypothetical protein
MIANRGAALKRKCVNKHLGGTVHDNFSTDTGDSLHVNLAAVGMNVDGTGRYVCDFVRSVHVCVLILRKQTQGSTKTGGQRVSCLVPSESVVGGSTDTLADGIPCLLFTSVS